MSDLDELKQMVVQFRDARDWKQFHNPKDEAISLALEAAELLEEFQWKNPDEVTQHLRTHKAQVEDELADVLYFVLLMANDLDIDLKQAFIKKLAKSEAKYPVEKARGRHTKYTDL